MNSHAASGSPPSLAHRDSLSSNSSENTEVGAKEGTPAALADGATAGGAAAAGDDAPAPPVVKAGRKLPKPVTDFLRKWLLEHADHPYPNEQEKKMLCEKTGLTMHQLSNWMINVSFQNFIAPSEIGLVAVDCYIGRLFWIARFTAFDPILPMSLTAERGS
ncbi:hypothetical protein M407DRAFT_77617 [Tulasnella calospora MUT 4182]|uniref:KN homeodomain domain-containing protein n=1 Tax=Tulasnella calospora MUT 4182 TaxID=1051891 RepID=A0A0C3Q4K9_9AGAM|nr:hypothetical protein M407DRAFT_77617 [Tulasnella calospora MUT 4182]